MHQPIHIITTGGTIEKTYDERTGELKNTRSIVDRMLKRLTLPDTTITIQELLSKDSLHFTDDDRNKVLHATQDAIPQTSSIVILHGTDTLETTGRFLHHNLPQTTARIVITGAMRPFEMRRSDALQNLTEALIASTLLWPGIYFVGHGKSLPFPNLTKNRDRSTFEPTTHNQ